MEHAHTHARTLFRVGRRHEREMQDALQHLLHGQLLRLRRPGQAVEAGDRFPPHVDGGRVTAAVGINVIGVQFGGHLPQSLPGRQLDGRVALGVGEFQLKVVQELEQRRYVLFKELLGHWCIVAVVVTAVEVELEDAFENGGEFVSMFARGTEYVLVQDVVTQIIHH